mmetsp:Transcript_26277/g.78801  ORF Transcript_26277/g.78801 Transcript_26277/m.78801 type:complete len:85 (+) Transcript_26277:660-914(+)
MLDEAHARVERQGEETRKATMSALMVRLQGDVLVDYGYEPGAAGVAKFGMQMRKSQRGFQDDPEFRNLINELAAYGQRRDQGGR